MLEAVIDKSLGPNVARTHLLNYSSREYYSTTNPTYSSSSTNVANLCSEATMQQWSNVPLSDGRGSIQYSGVSGSSHQTYHHLSGHGITEIGVCQGNLVSSHQFNPPSHYIHGRLSQDARGSHFDHSLGVIPSYQAELSYSHLGPRAVFSDNGRHSLSESSSSRYTRPLSQRWQSTSRHGMWRAVNSRFHSVPGMEDAGRTASESVIIADYSSSDSSPRHTFDEYSNMRLDVDSMTYEELLALGESIGQVATGIPEEKISKCLTAKEFSDENQGGSCVICLDAYKIKDEIGAINKCGHEYHASCIKKWLLMKSVCPICKCAALDPPEHD